MRKRLLLRIGRSLRRLDLRSRSVAVEPVDRAWHSMLARLDAEDRERRLRDAEAALNGALGKGSSRQA